MPLRWRKRPQRPPGPFVENEIDSLSRELNGSSHIGELPGFEGVKARGTVNQYPLILDIEILNVSNASSNVEEKVSPGCRSSCKPDTKPEPKQNSLRGPAGENQSQGLGKSHPRSPSKPEDVLPMSQPPRLAHTQVPELKKHLPGTSQEPVPRRSRPASRAPNPRGDALPLNLPPKPMPDVTQSHPTAPLRNTSLHRGQGQHKAASPTRYAQPDPVRNAGIRMSSPVRPSTEVTDRGQSTSSGSPPLRRGQEQHKSISPTRYAPSEPLCNPGVRTTSPPSRMPDVAQKRQTVPSRTPSVRRDKGERKPIPTTISIRSELARDSNVPASSFPPKLVSDVVEKPKTSSSHPSPVPQESQNKSLSTVPHHPGAVCETSMRGPALPAKQIPDATRQSQPTVPRSLHTPPDDGQRRTRPSAVTYQTETAVRDTGVRVEKLPPRSMPDVPQTIQHPLHIRSESVQYKSFPSSIPPPQSSLDTPPKIQVTPLRPLRNPPAEGPRMASSSTVKGSGSVSQGLPTKQSAANSSPRTSGYISDSGFIHHDHVSQASSYSSALPVEGSSPPSLRISVTERLEEKLKLRREQREPEDFPQHSSGQAHFAQSRTSSSPASQSPEQRAPPVQPPGAWPSDSPSEPPSSHLTRFPTLEHSAGEAKPQANVAPLKSALRSQSLDRTQPASSKVARRRTVAFAENPLKARSQALEKADHETALVQMQPHEDGSPASSRSSSPNIGFTLSPCPRSVPVAGYQDWHTIEGLTHLDICPSCIKQMRKTKFRDRVILSAPKPRTEPTHCAMSEPWTRLAWMQTLKKRLEGLDLLLEVTWPSQGIKPCTGRIINDQHWYRIIDPDTGLYLPQFNVCSACVRNIRLLMPVHRETFERSTTLQERACDLVTDSPRFIRYVDALDLAANRAEQEEAAPDIKEFLAYARRKVVLRDCRRSRLIFNTWHYMPQLPEFTVCEDCYDDIVWPLSKARHPIAREFSSVMRLLPGDTGSGSREASCQLYSPRIRAKFNDAVRRDDMPFIKWMAITRYEAEQRFRDLQDELLEDQSRGYDRSGDLLKNLEDWKRYE